MKSYGYLALSIISEAFGTTMLKLSNGFTVLFPSIGVLIGFLVSFYFLGLTLKHLSLATAYAIWAGAGTGLTAIIGIVIFHETVSTLKVISLLFIITGVVILNRSKKESEEQVVAS